MSKPVFRNSIRHKTSNNAIAAFPDVCKTPNSLKSPEPVPIPYPHLAKVDEARKEVKAAKKVKINSKSVAVKKASFGSSMGDEPGTLKGMVSPLTKGKAVFKGSTSKVKFQGKQPARTLQMTSHNQPSSTGPGPFPSVTKILVAIDDELSNYEDVIQQAPKLSYPDARRAQTSAEQKLGNLVNQLRNAAAGQPEHEQTSRKVEQVVQKALTGK